MPPVFTQAWHDAPPFLAIKWGASGVDVALWVGFLDLLNPDGLSLGAAGTASDVFRRNFGGALVVVLVLLTLVTAAVVLVVSLLHIDVTPGASPGHSTEEGDRPRSQPRIGAAARATSRR